MHRALKKLKPEYHQVLWLIYFENFSNKEAAKIMGKSVHNIETLVYRARKSLKSQLERRVSHMKAMMKLLILCSTVLINITAKRYAEIR